MADFYPMGGPEGHLPLGAIPEGYFQDPPVVIKPTPAGAIGRSAIPVIVGGMEYYPMGVPRGYLPFGIVPKLYFPKATANPASTLSGAPDPIVICGPITVTPGTAWAVATIVNPEATGDLGIIPPVANAVAGVGIGGVTMPAILAWPTALPFRPLTQSYLERPDSLICRMPMDAGPAKVRPLRSAAPRQFTAAYIVNEDQLAGLWQFYEDCHASTQWFLWLHPRTCISLWVRFIEPPTWQSYGEGKYIAMVRLEARLN